MTTTFLVPGPTSIRLDLAVAAFTGSGRRRCQRLVKEGQVLVDGQPGRKGMLVAPGQRITIVPQTPPIFPPPMAASLLSSQPPWAFLAKPAGMPTTRGSQPGSLEEALPGLGLEGWRLVNRLDTPTSGIVLAVATPTAAANYQNWQDAGKVAKWYLAIVHGSLRQSTVVAARIDDARRRTVRVLASPDPSPLRHTALWPLAHHNDRTLVLAHISKGRRHQIRAHLASLGHPILGDAQYGADRETGLRLHHVALILPKQTGLILPPWPEWRHWSARIEEAAVPPAVRSWWPHRPSLHPPRQEGES